MRTTIALTLLLVSCGAAGATSSSTPPASEPPARSAAAATAPSSTSSTATRVKNSVPPMVITSKTGEVALVGGDHKALYTAGVVSPSQRVVVSGTPSAVGTLVEWRDSRTAEVTGSTTIAGAFQAVAVDATDKVAALIDGDPADLTRSSTTVVLADAAHGELHRWTVPAAVMPEAFANAYDPGGDVPLGVFTIEYLDEATYRVRVLDTNTGELGLPLNLRNKAETVDDVMTAVSRTAVFEPVNQMLFTLYQGATENGEPEGAFIHTLGLFNGVWCLDVPEDLGLADHAGALAVSPDGQRLFAASGTGGVAGYVVADILNLDSPEMPSARAVVDLNELNVSPRVAIGASNDLVVVALGSRIWYLDPATLAVRDQLTWDMGVEALTVLDDGSIVIVGTRRMTLVSPDHQLLDEMPMPMAPGEIVRASLVG